MGLPTGTMTLMFTDIQGSTRLLERIGDDYAAVLQAYHAILREALARYDGQEIRAYGDTFFAVFADAGRAVLATAAIQRELAAHAWPGGHAVPVRVGLHTGQPRVVDGDYIGLDVHTAARICGAAHGGQVVVSRPTREALGDELPDGLGLRELGEHRLSDLSQPVGLFQLAGDGLAERFPSLRGHDVARRREASPLLESDNATLVGRADEQASLERVLTDARLGSSKAVVLSGEPGMGKTALLRWLAARGAAEGMEILWARGIESEAEVPFGGLLELFRPALGELDRIPAAQADALRSALGLGPSMERDRFLIGAATLSLLSACSEQRPTVAIVDDAHWLDDSSLAALVFAARRLLVDPVAVIFATRTAEAPALDSARLPELALKGVDSQAAAHIVAQHAATPPSSNAVARLQETTGGNPLALVELARTGADLDFEPMEGPLEVETSVARAYAQRIVELAPPTQQMLALAATEQSGRLAWIGVAAADLGLELSDLEPGEREGLVSISFGVVSWKHPLVRSAAYHALGTNERRAMHAALARALPDTEGDRRTWHRAAAALGADEEVAAALEDVGRGARTRSAYAAAATAAERAADLSPTDAPRARRLFAAAEAAWLGGDTGRVGSRLDEALALDPEPPLRAEIQYLRGQAAIRAGDVMAGHHVLIDGAVAIEETDPARAVVMLAEATDACVYAGRPAAMLRPAQRAYQLLPASAGEREHFFAELALGTALIYAGEGDRGAQRLKDAVGLLEASDVLSGEPRSLSAAALAPLWLREARTGESLAERAIEAARSQGAVGALPFALTLAAREAATTDRWAVGRTLYAEAIGLARETDQAMPLCGALAGLASLDARQGQQDACRADAQEALALSAKHGLGLFRLWALDALAELDLGTGRLEEAVRCLRQKQQALDELELTDPDLSPVPELVEAAVRAGSVDPTPELTDAFGRAAEAKGQPWALARLARTSGLLADADAFEHHFSAALDLHAATPDRFETARTELCYGERLRRAGQRVRAREQLRTAHEAFDELGATPWADRAGAELQASGERARKRDPSTLDDLTPQELQIGLLLTSGHTTRQAAAKLFLSPKTVEYHLRNAYRKLGIHSRDELAQALPGRDRGTEASED